MRSRSTLVTIALLMMTAVGYQSCDSTLNIDKPATFLKYLGSDGSQTGVDMEQDAEGNIYVLGSSSVEGGRKQIYVVKTTPEGITIWERLYGDPSAENLEPKDIERLQDGSLVVIGDRVSGTAEDMAIYIIAPQSGDIIKQTIAGASNLPDHALSITQYFDDAGNEAGFLLASYKDTANFKLGWTWRFDSQFNEVKEQTGDWNPRAEQVATGQLPSGYDFVPVKVFEVLVGGTRYLYTFGYSNSPRDDQIVDYNYFINVANLKNERITTPIIIPGPTTTSDEKLTSAKQVAVADGDGFVLTGYITGTGSGTQDLFMVRLNPDLTNMSQEFPSSYLYTGRPPKVVPLLSNGGALSATVSPSKTRNFLILAQEQGDGNSNLFLTKTDEYFNYQNNDQVPLLSRSFGGVGNDTPGAVLETGDGHILVCGTMVLGDALGQTKIVLMRLNSEGMLGDD